MSIVLERLTKRYDGHPVVNNVTLEIADGEFFVLLGSSGSGKTTILSLIAGLTQVDHGRILLHGRDVTSIPTQQRRVGFVFQNYALFQHMSVAENIEFGLKIRKAPVTERHHRCDELLELVGLSGLGDRMPKQLSGGQQQRVALARALAHRPDVLLLDEPLGALDAKIRVELRRTLRLIQQQLRITTILVTHDQEEAFDLADRIGVMSFGRLLEVGEPRELYQKPKTEFVASFLGTANLLLGNTNGDTIQVGSMFFPKPVADDIISENHRVQVLFRPEDVSLAFSASDLGCPHLGKARVEECSFGGAVERLRLRVAPMPGVRPIAPPVAFGSDTILVEATRSPDEANRLPMKPGDVVWLGVRRIHALVHPGLNFLIVTDGSLRTQAAIRLGGQIARLAHARVTLLGVGQKSDSFESLMQETRKQIGSGLAALEVHTSTDKLGIAINQELEQQVFDLIILGFNAQEDIEMVGDLLQAGEHHLLLVPCPQSVPTQALICVASGEPGKDDVIFAGRLIRHLGADATLMSVLSENSGDKSAIDRIERFLAGGMQTLDVLGVQAKTVIRKGAILEEIQTELLDKDHDLLVIGAPLPNRTGEISLEQIVGPTLRAVTDRAILIVKSHYMGVRAYQFAPGEMKQRAKEMVR